MDSLISKEKLECDQSFPTTLLTNKRSTDEEYCDSEYRNVRPHKSDVKT